ncbi:MAG: 6-phosphogluconolactonase [Planctomycetota bacterium]
MTRLPMRPFPGSQSIAAFLLALGLWSSLLPGTSRTLLAKTVIYVSVAAEKRIDVYDLEATTGKLTRVAQTDIEAGEPGALTTDPQRRLLLAAIRSTGKLASYTIDPQRGTLTPVSVVEAGPDPAQISTDRTGTYLLTAYYVAAKVSVHRIGADGTLQMPPVQEIPTAEKAHAIVPDPSNQFVYVPHTGPNMIFQFRFDPQSGKLSPLDPDRQTTAPPSGPRHLVFHPTTAVAYVDNEQGSSVTAWVPDARTGNLSAAQTLPTIPASFRETNSCAEIRIHPTARFLYVANRGHNSIAAFAIDNTGRQLRSLGQTATEAVPRSFDIDPSGRYLIAAGEASGKLATYAIDPRQGTLKPLATYEAGKMPWWVMAISLPE